MRAPGFITRNFRLKVLASGVALMTWIGVVYASNPPESRTVNVHVPQDPASLPSKYVLASPIPDVQVRVSGTREHVNAFDVDSLRVSVDYKQITGTGVQQVPIRISNNDGNVSLDQVPSTVTADVDVHDSVNVPVTVVMDSTPPAGYVVTQQAVAPNPVVVTGPHRELTGLSAQVHLNLSNQKTNLQGDYKIFLFDRFGRKVGNLGVQPDTVNVTVTVSSVNTSRASAVLPKVSGSVAFGHELTGISVSPLTVVLNGPQELLNALDSIPTQTLSIAGLTGDRTFQVKLSPPAGVTTTPDTVTVTVSVVTLATPTPTPAAPTPSPTPTATPSPPPSSPSPS